MNLGREKLSFEGSMGVSQKAIRMMDDVRLDSWMLRFEKKMRKAIVRVKIYKD